MNPRVLKRKIEHFVLSSSATSTSVPSTSALPFTSTVSPAVESLLSDILQNLNLVLLSTKSDALLFPGDKALVADFLNQNSALTALVNQLEDKLPFTTLDQVNDASNSVQVLKNDQNNFLTNQGKNIL